MSPRIKAAVAALMLLGLGACGGASLNPVDWFSSSKALQPEALADIAKPIPQRILWQVRVGNSSSTGFVPLLVQGSVYAAAQDGTVLRLDEKTGREIWRTKLDSTLSAGVGSNGK